MPEGRSPGPVLHYQCTSQGHTSVVAVVQPQAREQCLTVCGPMACSPPDSSVRGIFRARILEWVAISFSKGSSQPGVKPMSLVSPALAGGFFYHCTT